MAEDTQKVHCFFKMATTMVQAGITALGKKDFLTALQALHDCYRPVQECFRFTSGKGDIFKETLVIEQDVLFHLATAEAMQAIKIGSFWLLLLLLIITKWINCCIMLIGRSPSFSSLVLLARSPAIGGAEQNAAPLDLKCTQTLSMSLT